MVSKSDIVLIRNFRSQILQNERDLLIYVPPGYEQDIDQRYPVLYVHDGQNVFGKSYNGYSWNLQLICDRLIAEKQLEPLLVVAVSNMGSERSSEFAHPGPYAELVPYSCRGEDYEQFLIEELKPLIDTRFRTRKEAEWTALLGSSRAGLVTYHIGFRRPDIFSKLAIISPYYAHYNELTRTYTPIVQNTDYKQPLNIWMDVGGMEGVTVRVDHVQAVVDHLLHLGYRLGEELIYYYDPIGVHNEEAWASRVHYPLLYFFGKPGAFLSEQLL